MKSGKGEESQDHVSKSFGINAEDRGALETVTIRLHTRDREELKRMFERKGIPFTTGVRMVLREYIDAESKK